MGRNLKETIATQPAERQARIEARYRESKKQVEGDEVGIPAADAREFAVARKPGREELPKRLRAFRGRLPADFKFDRDEENSR